MTIVSAPGKVLVTGAYLVLERPNPGLVLSTSARFYAIIKPLLLEDLPDESVFWAWIGVRVFSPQLDKTSSYKLELRTCELKDEQGSSRKANFVEDAIKYGVATALAIPNDREGRDSVYKQLLHGLDITILGSNDFYSFRKEIEAKGLPLTASTLSSLPAFSPVSFNRSPPESGKAPEVAKTGLGSSAAMTTAIVAGILEYLGVVQLTSPASLDFIHAASQAAHCHAQGKIGSGFDVSAAVYGSQKYVRFSPAVLHPAMDPVIADNGKPMPLEKAMKEVLQNRRWDAKRSNFALPPNMYLMLGEPGHGGSDTPSMVGIVNAWRKNHSSDAEFRLKELLNANENVEKDLLRLKELHDQNPKNYTSAIQDCCRIQQTEWGELKGENSYMEVVSALCQARDHFLGVRKLLREIGEKALVPIEPDPQTKLLDKTMDVPGVLFAGVPGAGGFDAVFAITISEDARSQVEKLWSEERVLSLTVLEDPRGVCVENADPRQGLPNAWRTNLLS